MVLVNLDAITVGRVVLIDLCEDGGRTLWILRRWTDTDANFPSSGVIDMRGTLVSLFRTMTAQSSFLYTLVGLLRRSSKDTRLVNLLPRFGDLSFCNVDKCE